MINDSELVTTALLGTDRRALPVPGDDPEHDPAAWLLDQAARSAVGRRAGVRLPVRPPVAAAPEAMPTVVPPAAAQLLSGLLARPVIGLINAWLRAAAARSLGAAPQHWPALISLAARQPELDRSALGQVLGPRGVWLCEQNPQWKRLAAALRGPAARPSASVAGPTGPPRLITPKAVRQDPELIMEAADPWPPELTEAALQVIARGEQLRRTLGYAMAVGLRIPTAHYPLIRAVADQQARSDEGLSDSRLARDGLAALDRTVYLRREIEHAFTDHDHQEQL